MTTKLKFLNLNLYYSKNWQQAIELLQKLKPDIFTLQELSKNLPRFELDNVDAIENMKQAFPKFESVFAPICSKKAGPKETTSGNAIFSRFPIVSSQIWTFQHPEKEKNWSRTFNKRINRNIVGAKIKIKDKHIHIFTTHLSLAEGLEDNIFKIKEAKKIVEIIKNKKSVILTGDFNSLPNSKVIQTIREQISYVDQKNQFTWIEPTSFKKDTGLGKSGGKLDFIFATKDLQCIDFKLIDTDVSDHLALVAEFQF